MVAGAMLALIGIALAGLITLLIGVVVLGLGIARFWALRKPDYQVVLNASTTAGASRTVAGGLIGGRFGVGAANTNSLSQNFVIALSSKDGEFINRVIDALNEALVARG